MFDRFTLITGPCLLETDELNLEIARAVKGLGEAFALPVIFKASFDKANRTSHTSYRGPGLEEGLRIMESVKSKVGVPVLTDVHEDTPVDELAAVIDVIQTPAFLCRQTNFMQKWAKSGRPINVKKGQFMSPWEMAKVIDKMTAVAPHNFALCERGFSFGYNNLVVDMRGLSIMNRFAPVVFDCTHSVQLPGGQGGSSGGQREFIPVLARAAVGAGVAGLFMETHPKPDEALCDGPNSWPLHQARELLESLIALDRVVKSRPYAEDQL